MSLRTVADDTLTAGAMWPEPTGCAVSMYSSTTARRMAALRSSSICRADVTDPHLAGFAFGRLTATRNSQVTASAGRLVVTHARCVGAGMARSDEELLV